MSEGIEEGNLRCTALSIALAATRVPPHSDVTMATRKVSEAQLIFSCHNKSSLLSARIFKLDFAAFWAQKVAESS
ncbi:MAG: hypothetical protein A2098_00285 [Chlamydiae bacterium GWF2_49_8]|nr:MAG: hypothetical protein A2098_00285 [Chlamydiae bacterium GWF2_49_8]